VGNFPLIPVFGRKHGKRSCSLVINRLDREMPKYKKPLHTDTTSARNGSQILLWLLPIKAIIPHKIKTKKKIDLTVDHRG